MTSAGGTIATIQNMEVSCLCKNQSDPQCLELVTCARAYVASCLNTIDRTVACFTRLLADEFDRAARRRAHVLWLCQPSHQNCFSNFWKLSPRSSRGWICRRSTWLLAALSDLNLGEVYIKVCNLLWYKI